ncbi:hypothetical protein OTB20_38405 [Streptomyces sp. H27-H1]|uniref:hypothetical protein n=1 Tax=Streptomyces sp. H27-H1 TaxID=2996461 RepID=UPI00226D9F24|nr:hypothetical protein [Streptomyces sp. H27-H1]MCY0931949.1 hypothetical protein [Streptomyces sp. H27-H1]
MERLKLIEQFPAFKDLAKHSVDSIRKAHKATLDANEKSQEHFRRASQDQRDALKDDLGRDELGLGTVFVGAKVVGAGKGGPGDSLEA